LGFRAQADKPILVGSPNLIATFTQLDLIDEYQLGLQPTILGSGLTLFKDIADRVDLQLLKTKTFGSGPIMLCYERQRK
jgi:dihydrofolate reductase